jgi:regulator of sirC expression with transglutaminase-like and TPR domain
MFSQKEAIVRLLRDDDLTTVNLVKQQLAGGGSASIPGLRDLLSVDDAEVTRHVMEVLGEIDAREAGVEMERICQALHTDADLEQANWLLARIFLPGCDTAKYLRMINDWGNHLKTTLAEVTRPGRRITIFTGFMALELGFTGNSGDYYNPDNSLIPKMIETKRGIPISLSLMYMLVGRRAGLTVEGINFPGHFLIRCENMLMDPFEQGRVLTQDDCEEILARQKLPFNHSHLEAAAPRTMFKRMLVNLLYIYQSEGDEHRNERIAGWIKLLDGR